MSLRDIGCLMSFLRIRSQTERAERGVNASYYIRKVPCSNLYPDTGFPTELFSDLPQFLPVTSAIVP
jgi:hypothetical protein